jgi:hypothetical protein
MASDSESSILNQGKRLLQLDTRTKQLLRELGRAINEAVSDSDRIAEIISKIKASGYDVFLMLDAIVALNEQDALAGTDADGDLSEQRFLKSLKIRVNSDKKAVPSETEDGKTFTITPQDLKFLKALKINIDDLSD